MSGGRRDPVAEERRLKTVCGWSSREIAWELQDKQARGGDAGLAMGRWGGQLFRHESAVQAIAEEDLKDYIPELKTRGPLSRSLDGLLHSGDAVQLRWVGGRQQMALAALPASLGRDGRYEEPCKATAATIEGSTTSSNLRTAIRVYRNDFRIPENVPLMHEECIYLSTLQSTGSLFLSSQPRSFSCFAPLSEHQEVRWERPATARVLWKVQTIPGITPPSVYVQVNETVTLNHVTTNQDLTLEFAHKINTVFGLECEVSATRGGGQGAPQYMWQFAEPYDEWVMPDYTSAKRPPF